MSDGFVGDQEYLGQPFIDIKRNQMGEWLSLRGDKETRACDSCGKYKMKAKFYNWHHHPSLSFMEDERIGVICTPCARREAGSSIWKVMQDE